MAKFLDENGLLYFWQKLKTTFALQTNLAVTNQNVAAAVQQIEGLETLVGASSVASQISDAVNALDSSIAAETNQAIASLTIVNGMISGSTKVSIPTNNNQLTNGAGYQTAAQVDALIAAAVSGISQFAFEIVSTLPASGVAGTIYLVASSGTSGSYDEYIWLDSQWEMIGTTAVDLSGYWNSTNLTAMNNSDIDTIIAS